MKRILKHIIPYVLAFVLGALLFHGKQTPRKKCIQTLPKKTINYITTNTVPVIIKEEHTVYDTIHDTITIPKDSSTLMQDWLTKRYYSPIVLNDTNGFIKVDLTVSKNRLITWDVRKKLYIHSYKVTMPPSRKILLGGGVLVYSDKYGLFVGGIYQDRHNRAFQLMYDPIGRGIFLGAYWKISFRKKKERK